MRHKLCYRLAFYIFIFTIGMVLWFPHFSYAQEEIRLSTFYPAPLGEYDEITANSIFFNKTAGAFAQRLIAFDVEVTDTFDTRLRITAGSSDTFDNDQGACIDLHGNNHVPAPGNLDLVAGRGVAAPGGDILFFTGNPNALEVMRIQGNGNVVIPGSLEVQTALIKPVGTFEIPHPDPQKKESGWRLRHSFVESPTRGDNIYRFVVDVVDKETVIKMPEYYGYLNENTQIWASPAGHFGRAYGKIDEEMTEIKITADTDGEYNILVIGTRKDEAAKNFWDEKGVEYIKVTSTE